MIPPAPNATSQGRRSSSFTDNDQTPLASSRQRPEMTYFMTDEASIASNHDRSHSSAQILKPNTQKTRVGAGNFESTLTTSPSQGRLDNDVSHTNLGTRLEAATQSATTNHGGSSTILSDALSSRSTSPKASNSSAAASRDISPETRLRNTPLAEVSRPETPAHLQSPMLGSTPGSPISRLGSDTDFMTDDGASQAILSSGEDDTEEPMVNNNSSSQLVMPSLSLPSRKPFTDKGKTLGRLKIMIAGSTGVGKTSLVKAISQACEDIVHVDELPTSLMCSETRTKSRSKIIEDPASTQAITEVFASTRAYPSWWSDLDDVKVLKRRKSAGEPVLERNLCFVDTPGFRRGTLFAECVGPVLQYLETHLEKSSKMNMTDGELITMMSGSGGSQVDVVFYLVDQRLSSCDIDYLRRLSDLANVIPIIAKADQWSAEHIQALKTDMLNMLDEAQIKPFLFGNSYLSALDPDATCPPWAISALTGNDPENMDASLLMSPDYVSPLLPSDISKLVTNIFDRDSISWLRHSTAKKYVQHRSRTASTRSQSIPSSLASTSMAASPSCSTVSLLKASKLTTSPLGATNSYALARIADHTRREEQLAQVRLSNWAAELQQSLQNERLRFEKLARGERAVWLTERLNECVQDGTLVPASSARQSSAQSSVNDTSFGGKSGYSRKKAKELRESNIGGFNRADPLGLVKLNEEMQRRSWAALQIVGSFGILGGLAWWWSKGGWNGGYTSMGPDLEGQSSVGGSLGVVGEWGRMIADW